jgi:hypothetical protein
MAATTGVIGDGCDGGDGGERWLFNAFSYRKVKFRGCKQGFR